MANIFCTKHDIDNWAKALESTRSAQNFVNFGSQTAKNWTGVFTHPQYAVLSPVHHTCCKRH